MYRLVVGETKVAEEDVSEETGIELRKKGNREKRRFSVIKSSVNGNGESRVKVNQSTVDEFASLESLYYVDTTQVICAA